MKILITGINGFVGHHLVQELTTSGIEIIGTSREKQPVDSVKDKIAQYHSVDLANEWPSTEEVDAVIHLAGLAAVGPSFDNPQLYINVNSSIVTNLCEHYLKSEKKPRIILVSSGAVYSANQPMPITEDSELSYSSPYSISKILNENQATYYRERGLDIVCVRPFNHIGPEQMGGFLVPDLVDKLNQAKVTQQITVGNLDTKRDYTDVRDVARAYRLLATTEKLSSTIYNVCSGKSVSGKEILRQLQTITGVTDINVVVDQSKIRPNDPMNIFGDYSLLHRDTGWQPSIPLVHTLKDAVSNLS